MERSFLRSIHWFLDLPLSCSFLYDEISEEESEHKKIESYSLIIRLKPRFNPTRIPIINIAAPATDTINPIIPISVVMSWIEMIKAPTMKIIIPAITSLSQIFNTFLNLVRT